MACAEFLSLQWHLAQGNVCIKDQRREILSMAAICECSDTMKRVEDLLNQTTDKLVEFFTSPQDLSSFTEHLQVLITFCSSDVKLRIVEKSGSFMIIMLIKPQPCNVFSTPSRKLLRTTYCQRARAIPSCSRFPRHLRFGGAPKTK